VQERRDCAHTEGVVVCWNLLLLLLLLLLLGLHGWQCAARGAGRS
jgi:hypothetical protein